jgi:hypothetical protein
MITSQQPLVLSRKWDDTAAEVEQENDQSPLAPLLAELSLAATNGFPA